MSEEASEDEIMRVAEALFRLWHEAQAYAFKEKHGYASAGRVTWEYTVKNYPSDAAGWKALAKLFVASR